VLVIGAGLLIRSFAALNGVDVGFRTERLLVADTAVPIATIAAAPEAVRFYHTLLPEIAAVPGVEAVSAVMGVPTRTRSNGGYAIEGGPTFEQMGMRSPQAIFTVNTPDYFATLGVPVLKGRDFTDADNDTAPLVTVVNEALARQSFPNGDAIGHRIRSGYEGTGFMTIVGIVANMRSSSPAEEAKPQIFMPSQQHPLGSTSLNLVVRTALADPLTLAPTISQKVRALNSDVPVRMSTMDATIERATSTSRFRTLLLGLFAAVALKGRHITEGRPKTVTMNDEEIRKALMEPVRAIVQAVHDALERIPPELSADIFDRGIILTGGGSLLKNLDQRLREETGLPVQLAEDPLSSVVLGAGMMLSDFNLLRRISLD
jgi:putative ABC transport system permease protein